MKVVGHQTFQRKLAKGDRVFPILHVLLCEGGELMGGIDNNTKMWDNMAT